MSERAVTSSRTDELKRQLALFAAPTRPRLFVCDADDGGPSSHPSRREQEALRAARIEYMKVIAGHGNPIPCLRRDAREEPQAATGSRKLPALTLPDGAVITNSRAILALVDQQQ